MELGLMTEPQLGMTYGELLSAARIAEDLGLDAFARSDHYLFPRFEAAHATDAFATLAGLARETADIDLCVLVSPVTFRHPGVIAKTAATIDEMSGGRLRLGVGTGWMQEEHDAFGLAFYDQAERFSRLEETLGYLRAAFAVEKTGFDGSHYALEAIDALPGPTGPLPIIVGGGGRVRTPTLAGRFADEFNLAPMGHTKIVERIATARKAATDAGRDPAALKISMMSPAISGADEAGFRRNLAAIAAADPFDRSAQQIEARMREQGLPIGPPAEAGAVLNTLASAGVDRVYIQHFGPMEPELIGEIVAGLRG